MSKLMTKDLARAKSEYLAGEGFNQIRVSS